MRIGHGYDIHAFHGPGPVVLGGVHIDHDRGLAAHSDGDVVVHALCDALLGAAALGDLGGHFSDRDPAYADIDSRILLREVIAKLHQAGLEVGNVDVTVIAQAPRLAPHIAQMRAYLAADLGVDPGRVSVKATTAEGLGALGRSEGVAAHAVALVHETAP